MQKYGLIFSEAVGNVCCYENVEFDVSVVVTGCLTFCIETRTENG
jgi:hypothetical protein